MKSVPIILTIVTTLSLTLERTASKPLISCYIERIEVTDLEPRLCDRLIYGSLVIADNMTLKFPEYQPGNIISRDGFVENMLRYKESNPNVDILVSLTFTEAFETMIHNETAVQVLASSVARLLTQINFDGINLQIHPSIVGINSIVKVRSAILQILKKLRSFVKKSVLITSLLPYEVVESIEDRSVLEILDILDNIYLAYQTTSSFYTIHPSLKYPLTEPSRDVVIDLVLYLMKHSNHPDLSKIFPGIPSYASYYVLDNAKYTGLGSPAVFQKRLNAQEVCKTMKAADFEIYRIESTGHPFSVLDEDWYGYEDEISVARRATFARDNNLGVFFVLDADDHTGECSGVKFPLLKVIKNILTPSPVDEDRTYGYLRQILQSSNFVWWLLIILIIFLIGLFSFIFCALIQIYIRSKRTSKIPVTTNEKCPPK